MTINEISWKRRALFVAILALLGTIGGILAAEVFLRASHIQVASDPYLTLGRVSPFFEREIVDGKPFFRVANRDLYRERHVAFALAKEPGTFRVFCIGGSASAGWPHPATEIYSAYLQEALQWAYPSRRIEVINVSAHAYATYRQRMILEQVVSLDPDLLIIYAGNNEFIEKRTYRVDPRWYDPIESVAQRMVLYRLLRGSRRLFPQNTLDADERGYVAFEQWSKIEQLVLNLRRDPQQFERVKEHYAFSIGKMLEAARERHVPVALLTVPVNLRDWQPNVSLQTASGATLERWRDAYKAGRAALLTDSVDTAVARLRDAVDLDPLHGASHFFLARAQERRGDFDAAYESYSRARDLDYNPFRAISEFNTSLRRLAQANDGVFLVDADAAFKAETFPHAPGFDLFLDYVHPTKRGNLLLAKLVFEAIVSMKLVAPSPVTGLRHEPSLTAEERPYDERRDSVMQLTMIALAMMMHQYEAALAAARLVVETPHGMDGLDEKQSNLALGAYEIVPRLLALERRELLGPQVSPDDRAAIERELRQFYRSVWPNYKEYQRERSSEKPYRNVSRTIRVESLFQSCPASRSVISDTVSTFGRR